MASEEVVWWNAPGDRSQPSGGSTGGGVSVKFARPEWQDVKVASLNAGGIDGRVVPDVAALAGPPGYSLVFDGQPTMNGGTSAAAPLWAALIARIGAAPHGQKPGISRPAPVRARQRRACSRRNRVRRHHEGQQHLAAAGVRVRRAGAGFDAVSGWGVPNGQALLASLGRSQLAGRDRQTGQQALGALERRHGAQLRQNRDRLLEQRSGFVGALVVDQHAGQVGLGTRASQYG